MRTRGRIYGTSTPTVRPVLWFCLGFVLILWGGAASAQSADSCTEEPAASGNWYKYGISSAPHGGPTGYVFASGDLACSYAKSTYCAAYPSYSGCTAQGPWYGYVTGSTSFNCRQDAPTAVNRLTGQPRQKQLDPAVDCPADPPPECDFSNGSEPLTHFTNPGDPVPLAICDGASGFGSNCTAFPRDKTTTCSATRCGTIYYTIQETYTEGGPNPPPSNDAEAPPPSQQCATVGAAEYCWDTGGDVDCGWVNGVPVCLGATPKGGCQDMNGGALCDPSASSPPAPDDGVTPGVPADPDGQVIADSGNNQTTNNTYNYYTQTTVNASQGTVQTGNPTQSGDYDGDGFTNPDQEEEYTGTSGQPTFDGSGFGVFDADETWGAQAPWQTEYSTFESFLSNTAPFSLVFSGPISMANSTPDYPTITYSMVGHTESADLSMWEDLFTFVRAGFGLILAFGFWMVIIATLRNWAT